MSPKNSPRLPHSYSRDAWAITLFLIGIFTLIHNNAPLKTGWVGVWIMEGILKHLTGHGMAYFPLCLMTISMGVWFSRRAIKSIVIGGMGAFLMFVLILEMWVHGRVSHFPSEVGLDGGGWIGALGSFGVQTLVGYTGAWLLIIGLCLVFIVVMFQISLKKALMWLVTLPPPPEGLDSKQRVQKRLWFKRWANALFYTQKNPLSQAIVAQKPSQNIRKIKDRAIEEPETFLENETLIEPEIKKTEPEIPLETPQKSIPVLRKQSESDSPFELPPLELLEKPKAELVDSKAVIQKRKENAAVLEMALASFGVEAKVVHITPGPSVTRYELQPGEGVKIIKITALNKDIALKLAVVDVRIEAPIPGKSLIGIEVPNSDIDMVVLKKLIDKSDFFERSSKLLCAMGLTITGEPVLMDLAKMPHILIAGATGSGKSVCVNAIIISILLRATPQDVKFLMIDPKKVELSLYEGIPHLIAPVVTNPHKAAATLKQWALLEMERRYEEFSRVGVKDIDGYNAYVVQNKAIVTDRVLEKIPYIVVIIDELADLMMVASQDVESTICRLAQMSRATGIHLVIATQRPSVNVITGLIKANVPSRISFFLQSQIDSRTILDMPGAEKLLGKGDMLYSPVGSFKPKRVQGIFVSEKEVKSIVTFLKAQGSPNYLNEILDVKPLPEEASKSAADAGKDELYEEAKSIVVNTRYASTSYLQRKLRIGYNRAARLMEELETEGIISQYVGEKKPRNVAE